ncbi:hypothetical protein D3C71_2079320 [compost metagenome]
MRLEAFSVDELIAKTSIARNADELARAPEEKFAFVTLVRAVTLAPLLISSAF